jgi:hypothetical protein
VICQAVTRIEHWAPQLRPRETSFGPSDMRKFSRFTQVGFQ